MNFRKAFTLIELLIVIGILAVLATVVLLVINPAQLVKQSRDGNRMTEIIQLDKALSLYQAFGGTSSSMGSHGTVYISIPDTTLSVGQTSNCSSLNLPTLETGYVYRCSNPIDYQKIDGTGWIPVNFTLIQSSAGTVFSNLPIDPNNVVTGNLYYTYIPGSWALSTAIESEKYLSTTAVNDGGKSPARFEVGNNLALDVPLSGSCSDTVTDIDGNIYSNVLIGKQCWMAENIRTSKYPDGTAITRGPTGATWSGGDDHGYYAYPPNTSNDAEEALVSIISNKLGFVYQWSAAMHGSTTPGAQGICPNGWHVPTDNEFMIMEEYLGMCSGTGTGCSGATDWRTSGNVGSKLSLYTSGGTNSSGFSGILSGIRTLAGSFSFRNTFLYFWTSSTSPNGSGGIMRELGNNYSSVMRAMNIPFNGYGFSIRCLKN